MHLGYLWLVQYWPYRFLTKPCEYCNDKLWLKFISIFLFSMFLSSWDVYEKIGVLDRSNQYKYVVLYCLEVVAKVNILGVSVLLVKTLSNFHAQKKKCPIWSHAEGKSYGVLYPEGMKTACNIFKICIVSQVSCMQSFHTKIQFSRNFCKL